MDVVDACSSPWSVVSSLPWFGVKRCCKLCWAGNTSRKVRPFEHGGPRYSVQSSTIRVFPESMRGAPWSSQSAEIEQPPHDRCQAPRPFRSKLGHWLLICLLGLLPGFFCHAGQDSRKKKKVNMLRQLVCPSPRQVRRRFLAAQLPRRACAHSGLELF
eukprot:1320530-Amphidinium_carterae.1